MAKISYLIEFSINDGQLEAFKGKAQGFAIAVEEDEPGTTGYQWWLGEDGKHCLIHETFEDSDAFLTHLENVGPGLPDLLALAPITRCEVFGTVNDDVRGALAGLGAKHFPHLAGFDR